jgi:hypothetical protein
VFTPAVYKHMELRPIDLDKAVTSTVRRTVSTPVDSPRSDIRLDPALNKK